MKTFTELLSPAFWADPGHACQPWLAEGPAVLPCALGGWAILGHAALAAAARHPAVEGCRVPADVWPGMTRWPALLSEGLFARQGRDHAVARATMISALGAAQMARIAPAIAARAVTVTGLPDGADLTEDLARPLMTGLWSDLTGIPPAELSALVEPLAAFASFLPDASRADEAEAAADGLLRAMRDAPRDAPLLAGLDAAGRRLVAGMTVDAVDTAPAGLAGALAILLRAEWGRAITPAVAEEAFRLAAPSPATVRQTTAPVRIGEVDLPAEALLWMVWAAGDHDPARHADPLAFRPDRPDPLRALAFGAGGHACLGRGLMRQMLMAVWPHLRARKARLAVSPTFRPGVPRAPVGARLGLA